MEEKKKDLEGYGGEKETSRRVWKRKRKILKAMEKKKKDLEGYGGEKERSGRVWRRKRNQGCIDG